MKKQKTNDISNNVTDIQQTSATQTYEEEKIQKFHFENGDKYPNRLISYVKIKIKVQIIQKPFTIKGTGCLISPKYLLTAAHNVFQGVQRKAKLQNNKAKFEDNSYVRQGMGLLDKNQQNYLCQFSIKQYLVNPHYNNKTKKQKQQIAITRDFALLQVVPKGAAPKQEKYMPIVMLNQQSIKNIKSIYISGYPVQFNKSYSQNKDKSSVYMYFQCSSSASKQLKSFQKHCINYSIPTEKGISGAPIIAQYQNQYIIIGIHKGGNKDKFQGKQEFNVGVGAGHMIEQLNQFGYQLQKKPFVYTQKTLNLRGKQRQIAERQILFLMERNLQSFDMLVYTAFDLTNIKKILLSGNQIGNIGVQVLLRRKYPNIKSLFLTDNKIDDLSKIPKDNWNNIQSLLTLGLNVNQIKKLPQGLISLKNLQKLWVAYNQIKTIPQTLLPLCKLNNCQSFSIYIYQNQINFESESQKQLMKQFHHLKTRIIWNREGNIFKQQN